MKQLASLFFLVVTLGSFDAHALSVEEAYAAIPHHRTAFDATASRLSKGQVDSLMRLFALSDKGVVLRVEGLRAIRAADAPRLHQILNDYRALASSLASLNVPSELAPVQELIAQAVAHHQDYFESKLRDSERLARRDAALTADAYQASQKLHQAYDLLMQIFPSEPAVNKAAFYDYLCALDFI
jgi:hypothetical protein